MKTGRISPTLVAALISLLTAVMVPLDDSATETPVRHLEVPDVTSLEEARTIFFDTTAQLQSKTRMDARELNDIHMITYSLEKALAYFVENSDDKMKATADKMAIVIEEVYLGSENNRVEETRTSLVQYFQLAQEFSTAL